MAGKGDAFQDVVVGFKKESMSCTVYKLCQQTFHVGLQHSVCEPANPISLFISPKKVIRMFHSHYLVLTSSNYFKWFVHWRINRNPTRIAGNLFFL